jgi:hypothetical protein
MVTESKPALLPFFVEQAAELGYLKPVEMNIYVYENGDGFVPPMYKTAGMRSFE